MKRSQKNEFLGQAPEQQQHQQQHQQQTTVEEQRCPFFSATTPVWGDRNVVSNRATPLRLSFISLFLSFSPQYASRTLFILWTLPPLYSTKCRRGNTMEVVSILSLRSLSVKYFFPACTCYVTFFLSRLYRYSNRYKDVSFKSCKYNIKLFIIFYCFKTYICLKI